MPLAELNSLKADTPNVGNGPKMRIGRQCHRRPDGKKNDDRNPIQGTPGEAEPTRRFRVTDWTGRLE